MASKFVSNRDTPPLRARLVGAFGVVVSLAACTHVDGVVTSQRGASEDWTMPAQSCVAGDRLLFNGVAVASKDPSEPHAVLVVADVVNGPTIVVADSRTHQRVALDKTSCEDLDASLMRHSYRVNGVHGISGYARFTCTTASGESIHGDLQFDNCH